MLKDYPCVSIGPGIWEINEFDCASLFLITGSERALLIDTGIGLGDLPAFLSQLTALPITVLLTHNHRDHVGGAPWFDEVYISETDAAMGPMLRPLTAWESRLDYAQHVKAEHLESRWLWTENDLQRFEREPKVIPIQDGHVFSLGGRTVTCWMTPGHTPGSLSAIDSQSSYLFCGDACNGTVGLGVRPIDGIRHASMEEALIGLQRVWEMDFDRDHIYCGHVDFRGLGRPLPNDTMPKVMKTMEYVIGGNYISHPKRITSIQADVEIVTEYGVELQFHRENIRK